MTFRMVFAAVVCLAAAACGGKSAPGPAPSPGGDAPAPTAAPAAVPGMWAATDTSQPLSIDWPASWAGARNLRAQWYKILAEPRGEWDFQDHAVGEAPGNTYFVWYHQTPLPEGTLLLLEGDFPHARQVSIQVGAPWSAAYPVTTSGTGIPEAAILDEDIVPDPGSTNPFLPGADRSANPRHYHLTFELRDGNPLTLNGAAFLPPYRAPGNLRYGGTRRGTNGEFGPYLWVRIYLPDGNDPYGGVEPPVLRIQLPGQAPELAPISHDIESAVAPNTPPYSAAENPALADGTSPKENERRQELRAHALAALEATRSGEITLPGLNSIFAATGGRVVLYKLFQPTFFVMWTYGFTDPALCPQLLPAYQKLYGALGPGTAPPGNDEHNSGTTPYVTYVGGVAALKPGELLVFQGKAPATPRTRAGERTVPAASDLRYWGLSLLAGDITHPALTPVVDLVDEDVVLDASGHYTIVIGREADRPAGATAANGVTWRTWPLGTQLSILFRFMSTAAKPWAYAPQLMTWDEGGYCVPGQNPAALEARMGEYFPQGRYLAAGALAGALSPR